MSVSGRTALYGLIGDPVGASRSPAIQNAALAACGIDGIYVPLPVEAAGLEAAVRGAHALGFRGLNVTVPHKEAALALCARLDRSAEEIGAVNTLRRTNEGFEGFNTDAPACLALLEAVGLRRQSEEEAVVLGAGGAARAAVWALLSMGMRVRVAGRSLDRAVALCHHFLSALPQAGVRAQALGWSDVPQEAARARVVVNATPLTTKPDGDGLPAIAFRKGQIALDFVYGPAVLARRAAEAGATVITGESLLVRQGALAFAIWHGRAAPEAVMTAALQPAATPGGKR